MLERRQIARNVLLIGRVAVASRFRTAPKISHYPRPLLILRFSSLAEMPLNCRSLAVRQVSDNETKMQIKNMDTLECCKNENTPAINKSSLLLGK